MEFNVRVIDGDVYINDELVGKLCWTNNDIGYVIGYWLNKQAERKLLKFLHEDDKHKEED